MVQAARALALLRGRGHAAFLSGAGPSLLVLAPRSDLGELRATADEAVEGTGWRVVALEVSRSGAAATARG
jgi:homoserine kinase